MKTMQHIQNNKNPILSIIYVYYNTPSEITESISSVTSTLRRRIPYEIIIVDNDSHLPVPSKLLKLQSVQYIKNKKNQGYGQGLNIGAKHAKGTYILCSNTDTIYREKAILLMLEKIKSDHTIGIIGPKMIDKSGKRLDTASKLPLFPRNFFLYTFLKRIYPFSQIEKKYHYRDIPMRERTVDAIGGASMMFRKEVFRKIGGFDKSFFLYFEETDICKRLREKGYQVVYFPKSVVTHLVGRSLQDNEKIQTYFERSRFLFIKKHQSLFFAYLSEIFIRFFTPTTFILIFIVGLSMFLNLYKISTLMMFFGDFGRDMLVAREMVLTGNIPLLGIPSSVVWLSQGPLSIYLIGVSFLIGGFSPFVPAILYGVLSSFTCLLIYHLGNKLFNKPVGIMSALIFACSPLVIVNARIPYHTAPIPFFSAIFFIALFSFVKNKTYLSLMSVGFFLGLLFQLELSNGVLFFLLVSIVYIYKIQVTKKRIGIFSGSFAVGILPFILYDLTHMFTQTAGFVAWVLNRIRLFLGLTVSGNSTTAHAPDAFHIVWDNLVRFVFPMNEEIATIFIVTSVLYLLIRSMFKKMRQGNEVFLIICLSVPFIGFIVHARPGMAYFPVVYPLLAIVIGEFFYMFYRRLRMALLLFFVLIFSNTAFILTHSYFLSVNGINGSEVDDWNYGLGVSLGEQMEVMSFLKAESEKTPIQILPGGFLTDFQTSIDNYHFLALSMGIHQSKSGREFTIYQDPSEISQNQRVIFQTEHVYVSIDE